MSKRLIIFGTGNIAELAWYYFTHDSEYEVVAFCVDREYIKGEEFFGRPVVAFDQLAAHYSIAEHSIFIALSYSGLNALRRDKYREAKALGYPIASYVSSKANIFNDHKIGENCFVLEDNTIQPFVVIGNNVTLWSGNHIGHHSTIADHVFIASHVVVSGGCHIAEACFIGVNATIRDHVNIGAQCVIGAGALILADTDAQGVYIGSATERSRVPSNRLRNL